MTSYLRIIAGLYLAVIGSMLLAGADWSAIRPMLGAGMMLTGFGVMSTQGSE